MDVMTMGVLGAGMLSSCAIRASGDSGDNWEAWANDNYGVLFLPLSLELDDGVSSEGAKRALSGTVCVIQHN